MALVNITNVLVQDNPAPFSKDFAFEITFECLPPGLKEELEWKLVYVGSADDEKHDQELDSVLVGPVSVGKNKFVFTAPAPDPSKIPEKDLLEVTVILLTCSYKEREFIRIGYYVNTDYGDDEELNTNRPEKVVIDKLWRNVLWDKPRVTRFLIPWDEPEKVLMPEPQPEVEENAFMEDEEIEDDAEAEAEAEEAEEAEEALEAGVAVMDETI